MVMGYEDGYRVSWQTSLGGIPKDVCEENIKLWSADHCSLDVDITKGVFFANRPLAGDTNITDVAPTVLRMMGVEPPEPMDGKPIWD
jgi:bisphosphoglycerate-independent phosphoglycerate mutase (AlkP superfamily)